MLKKIETTTVEVEPETGREIRLAQWYWVKDEDEEWLGCVTHIGSNYIEITSAETTGSVRVHVDEFHDECRLEPDASNVIKLNVRHHRSEIARLMREVEALTSRLGVGDMASLPSGSQGTALARLTPNVDAKKYKEDLVKAKKEELPALFEKIEEASKSLSRWMKAETLPIKSQLSKMKKSLKIIEDRIFNVELYAGLTEEVEQITDGEPAPMTEKIRLMQRRCYMDEECLIRYETGGMEFNNIRDFDAWLARPENRDRILPFPRCIVAFRVRRKTKFRPFHDFITFFYSIKGEQTDKFTFLYIRNGERLYRMDTSLEFEEQLFPDAEHHKLLSGAKLWARVFADSFSGDIITDNQYQDLIEKYRKAVEEDKRARVDHKLALRRWHKARRKAEREGQEFTEREPHYFSSWLHDPAEEYEPFEPGNVYYDDVRKKIEREIQQYNRIAIIIQGLLDRSPVFHPHPPWRIWSEQGFNQALELIYDSSRALSTGTPPDFEAYRKKLNSSLKTGSVTVGQKDAWHKQIEDKKRKNFYYDKGPASLSRVDKYEPRKKRCNYVWFREGETYDTYGKKIRCRLACEADQVLNVDAYTPGDFHIFFDDPRTRADYLEWAPLLLEAEEYHAGNRTCKEEDA